MKPKINNAADLKREILRLNNLKKEQEGYLREQWDLVEDKVTAPFKRLNHFLGFIPNLVNTGPKGKEDEGWLGKGLRLGIPFLLNRVFFKKAGVAKRLLMAIVSNQALGLLNKDLIAQGIDKITAFIRRTKVEKRGRKIQEIKNKKSQEYNFGIPPDSETY